MALLGTYLVFGSLGIVTFPDPLYICWLFLCGDNYQMYVIRRLHCSGYIVSLQRTRQSSNTSPAQISFIKRVGLGFFKR